MTNKPLPPWDWKHHWYNHLGHALLGILVAGIVCSGWAVAGCAILTCYLVYQWLEFLRRGDTPARDVKVFMVGLVPVLAAGWGWGLL